VDKCGGACVKIDVYKSVHPFHHLTWRRPSSYVHRFLTPFSLLSSIYQTLFLVRDHDILLLDHCKWKFVSIVFVSVSLVFDHLDSHLMNFSDKTPETKTLNKRQSPHPIPPALFVGVSLIGNKCPYPDTTNRV
jgi:hypothetical protein